MTPTAGPAPDPIYVFYGFNGGVSAVSFVKLGEKYFILTGDTSGECVLWDLATRKQFWKYREEDAGLTKPSILSCGSWSRGIWAHIRGSHIRLWKFGENGLSESCIIPCPFIGFCAASVLISKVDSEISDFAAIAFENDGQYGMNVYRVSENGFALYSTINFNTGAESKPSGSPMSCLLIREQAALLLFVGFESGIVQLWRIDRESSIMVAEEQQFQDPVLSLDFHPDRRVGLCVAPGKEISCWRLINSDHDGDGNQTRFSRRDNIVLPAPGAGVVRVRNDGKISAVGCWDGKIRVYAVKTMTPLAVLQFHNESVNSLAFSSDKISGRRLIAAGSKDGSLSLWSLYND